MIWFMTDTENFAENLGKRNLVIFVLIDLKREIKENIVVVMTAKTYIECTPEAKPFWLTLMFYSFKNRDDSENLNDLISSKKQL